MRVVVTEPVHPDALALLRDAGCTLLGPALEPADAVLVRLHPLAADALAHVRMVAKHGVGVDNIDVAAARALGVVVANTPGANADAVAEQALMLMLMLALARDLDGQREGRRGAVRGLEGRRLFLVGFGASAGRVAKLAAAFGMAVSAWTPSGRALGVPRAASLAAGLAAADILSLHCPLTPQTRGMIGAAEIAAMPRGALIVNCARGGIVDERALADALRSGHLGGAALDVTEEEPLPQDHPLRAVAGLVLTPHAAGLSEGAFRRMGMQAAQNILDWRAGRLAPEATVA